MLIKKLKQLSSNQFAKNVGWLGGAELVQRVFRLVTTVTLARIFTTQDYGMVSAIYTTFEFTMTFSLRAGIGAKIIQADEEQLETICNTAYWLNWIVCVAIFLLQCVAAYPIAQFYGTNQLVLPLCVSGLSYLIFPFFMIQSALVERENRLHIKAWGYAAQAILSNVIIVVFALLGMGVWAVVWSSVLSYPVWIFILRHYQTWRPSKPFSLEDWQVIIKFGGKRLGVDLLDRLRFNIDYLLVGRFLGLEALGLYFFAFNAGIGISQSVLNSLTLAWYPHFCQVRTDLSQLKQRYLGSFKTIATIVLPLVVLQTSLAPFYVPIIFGQKWVPAIPTLIWICFSALPIALSRSNSQLLQSIDKTGIDFYWNFVFTIIFSLALLVVVQAGNITWVAMTVCLTQAIAAPIFTTWVIRNVLSKH
ncbi:lipopolysaccharide biosynthesis protein [Kovacikia minuta CCNUW1]|uniref:lipopolysaccharide biosynthesis protein n=1 Tax=Kovacikia minuta TaxID=2931930 RepID=UPI001CCFFA30|nr:lipopolysaccharide biosynthesis protein [Kovacikia minuta]UBF24884.1 lipopolysaccharide biosynthesis protein [Kovacikia minuta CCNUW1]